MSQVRTSVVVETRRRSLRASLTAARSRWDDWTLTIDAQEERLLQSLQASPAARSQVLDEPYALLRRVSEPVDGHLARVICESPLVILIPAPALVSLRVTAAQDTARALSAREAAASAVAEIRRSLAF